MAQVLMIWVGFGSGDNMIPSSFITHLQTLHYINPVRSSDRNYLRLICNCCQFLKRCCCRHARRRQEQPALSDDDSDDLWPGPVIIPRFNGSMVAIQSVDDHRGNHESRRRLRGIINHPGMTLKRTRDRLGKRTQRAPPPLPPPNAFVRPSHGCGDTQR